MEEKKIIQPQPRIEKVKGKLDFELEINLDTGEIKPHFPKPETDEKGQTATMAAFLFAFQSIQGTVHASSGKLILTGQQRKQQEAQIALKIIAEMLGVAGTRYLAGKNPKPVQKENQKQQEKPVEENPVPKTENGDGLKVV